MGAAEKFLFSRRFDAEPEEAEAEVPPLPTFGPDDIEAARAEGIALGRAVAERDAARDQGALATQALAAIAAALRGMAAEHQSALARHEKDAAQLAVAVVRRLVPSLAEARLEDSVAGLVKQAVDHLLDEPRIVVRVAEPMLETVQEGIERAASEAGYPGKTIIIGDPDLATTDCRVEWSDGGIERDHAAAWRAIDEAMARFLDAGVPDTDPQPMPVETMNDPNEE